MNPLLAKLSQFVGYGSKDAKVIFIGIEEKTDDDKDAKSYEKRLAIQSKLEPFTDLQELCDQLDGLYNPQKSGPQPQPTWRPLCSVMLGVDGKLDQMDDDRAIFEYQRSRLGRIPGDSLLAELLPVPKSHMDFFGDIHSRLLDIPPDIDAYRKIVLRGRRNLLADMLKERFAAGETLPPRLVIGYGRPLPWRDGRPWGQFEGVFEQALGQMKYDESDLRFEWAKMKGCLFVMTYHPGARDKYERWKFDTSVAKRIVEIYKEQIGS
jgi:hypothetical protein